MLASTRREDAAVEAFGMQRAKDDNHVHHATQAEGTRTHRSTVEWQKIAGRKYPSTDKAESCFRCGSQKHRHNECPFRTTKCYNCQKRGHVQRLCRGRQEAGHQKVYEVDTDVEDDGSSSIGGVSLREPEYGMEIHACSKDQSPGLLTVDVCLDSNPLTMELDTRAAVSLITEATYKRLWSATSSRPKLKLTDSTLRGYTGNQLRVLGTIDVHV